MVDARNHTPIGINGPTANMTWNEALAHFGVGFQVEKRPLVALLGNGQSQVVDNLYSIVRTDTNEALSGVAVNGRYTCIQTQEYADIGNRICGQLGAEFVRGGTLLHGSGLYLQAKLPDCIRVKGTNDTINKYLTFVTSHDGSLNFMVMATAMRLFCENQMNALMREARDGVKIRHTARSDVKLREVDQAVLAMLDAHRTLELKVNAWADQRFTDLQIDVATKRFFGVEPNATEIATRTTNNIEKVKELFVAGRGQEAFRGTAWAAINAFTEYVDHARSVNEGTDRFEASLIGSGSILRTKAINIVESVLAQQ